MKGMEKLKEVEMVQVVGGACPFTAKQIQDTVRSFFERGDKAGAAAFVKMAYEAGCRGF